MGPKRFGKALGEAATRTREGGDRYKAELISEDASFAVLDVPQLGFVFGRGSKRFGDAMGRRRGFQGRDATIQGREGGGP